MGNTGMLLHTFLEEKQQTPLEAGAGLTAILSQIAQAGKIISHTMRQAGLGSTLGGTGNINVHGEAVKKMDIYANNAFKKSFESASQIVAMITEEDEKPVIFSENLSSGQYIVYLDPLDGSSNIDVNGPVGSIFSIHKLEAPATNSLSTGKQKNEGEINASLLRKGVDQISAGYILYSSSTMLVYSSGKGVHGFTLDPDREEFLLSDENIKIPKRGKTYSVNQGNYQKWFSPTKRYIDHLLEHAPDDGRPYSSRYIGALIADVHRTLLNGGIYLYPGEVEKPEGKIRLLYESAPMSYIVEQAGGKGSTGMERILNIQPTAIHQRTPILIGSYNDVSLAEEFMRNE